MVAKSGEKGGGPGRAGRAQYVAAGQRGNVGGRLAHVRLLRSEKQNQKTKRRPISSSADAAGKWTRTVSGQTRGTRPPLA